MAVTIGTSVRDAMINAAADLLDASAGTIEVRTGAKPSAPADADSGTLLATFTLPAPAFGSASTGVVTAEAISGATAAATGTAGHYRVKNNGGTALWDGTVTITDGGGDLTMPSTSITSGEGVDITGYTMTMPSTPA